MSQILFNPLVDGNYCYGKIKADFDTFLSERTSPSRIVKKDTPDHKDYCLSLLEYIKTLEDFRIDLFSVWQEVKDDPSCTELITKLQTLFSTVYGQISLYERWINSSYYGIVSDLSTLP